MLYILSSECINQKKNRIEIDILDILCDTKSGGFIFSQGSTKHESVGYIKVFIVISNILNL